MQSLWKCIQIRIGQDVKNQEDRHSGGIIFAYGNPVAWYSEEQGCVTGSSSEAE